MKNKSRKLPLLPAISPIISLRLPMRIPALLNQMKPVRLARHAGATEMAL